MIFPPARKKKKNQKASSENKQSTDHIAQSQLMLTSPFKYLMIKIYNDRCTGSILSTFFSNLICREKTYFFYWVCFQMLIFLSFFPDLSVLALLPIGFENKERKKKWAVFNYIEGPFFVFSGQQCFYGIFPSSFSRFVL